MADLRALRTAVDDALRAARDDEGCGKDAVNWGDLSCISAESFVNSEGETGLRVWIEEASPEAFRLCRFVSAALRKLGFGNVDVRTEW